MKNGLVRWFCISLFFILHFSLFTSASAQIAGLNTLSLLDRGSSARTAGVGFDYLSLYGGDVATALDNPSLITTDLHNQAALSYINMFRGTNMGSLAYARKLGKVGTLVFGFHFNSYGRFEEYDEEDNYLGDFYAADYALSVGWGMWIDSNFSIGANFKPVLSQYESYTALAVAFDLAGSYTSNDRRFASTLMARNIGAQIMTFDETVEHLPFELSASLSYKLKNAPFRIFFAATELQKWNLRYNDELNPTSRTDPFTGEVTEESWFKGTIDNLMRHTLFGVELNLGTAIFVRVGYSYRQAMETVGADAFNMSGFSFGIGLKGKRYEFSYARSNYHLSQAPNYFTLSYNF